MRPSRPFIALIAIALLCGASGCSSAPAPFTTVGNPDEDVEQPTEQAMATKSFLLEHPLWKGSLVANAAQGPDLYGILFEPVEADRWHAVISTAAHPDGVDVEIEIEDNGSIATISASSGAALLLTAVRRTSSQKYPLDVRVEGGAATVKAYFSTQSDPQALAWALEPEEACLASPNKSYDVDGDLTGDASYYVAGFVQAGTSGEPGCGERFSDVCASDKELYEAVVTADEGCLGFFAAYRVVECDCKDGACTGEISDVTMPANPLQLLSCAQPPVGVPLAQSHLWENPYRNSPLQ